MQEYLPGVTDSQCDQKWRNLKQHWKRYVDNQKKTGRGRMIRPEFYNEMEEILGSSHTIRPPHTAETMTSASSTADIAGTAEMEATETSAASEQVSFFAPGDVSRRPKKRIRPSSSRERLEERLDQLVEKQDAATERQAAQFTEMMKMMDKHHKERMSAIEKLTKAIVGKTKEHKSGQEVREPDSGS